MAPTDVKYGGELNWLRLQAALDFKHAPADMKSVVSFHLRLQATIGTYHETRLQ